MSGYGLRRGNPSRRKEENIHRDFSLIFSIEKPSSKGRRRRRQKEKKKEEKNKNKARYLEPVGVRSSNRMGEYEKDEDLFPDGGKEESFSHSRKDQSNGNRSHRVRAP